jgi:hypothetical protein
LWLWVISSNGIVLVSCDGEYAYWRGRGIDRIPVFVVAVEDGTATEDFAVAVVAIHLDNFGDFAAVRIALQLDDELH